MLLYVVCTVGEFVWNEGGVVQLPAPYIMLSDFLLLNLQQGKMGFSFVSISYPPRLIQDLSNLLDYSQSSTLSDIF